MALDTVKSAVVGMAAATALMATPAVAAELPAGVSGSRLVTPINAASSFPVSRYDPRSDLNQWGCWGCGWGGGWRGGGWRGGGWRRRGPSAGEVLAGVAIIGGIAAIASAANRNRRNRDVVVVDRDRPRDTRDWDRDQRNPQWRDNAPRGNPRSSGLGGLDGAVSQCLGVIERDVRVDEVQAVQRTAQGWLVGGTLFNGSAFECRIGNDGRIENIDYGAGGPVGAASGGQWDDARYASARLAAAPVQPDPEGGIMMFTPPPSVAANNAQPLVPLNGQRLPAYPGGPIEGEELPPVVQRPGIP